MLLLYPNSVDHPLPYFFPGPPANCAEARPTRCFAACLPENPLPKPKSSPRFSLEIAFGWHMIEKKRENNRDIMLCNIPRDSRE